VKVLQAEALAKINRELRVGPRREDGYHQILSRFVSIDLADTLVVEAAATLTLTVDGAGVAADASNLVWKAARLLAESVPSASGARMRLIKRIPVGAGLGGGSADAAVTLLLLSQLWEAPMTTSQLQALGAKIGSDVPYFFVGGEADVRGRGELVTPREDGRIENLQLWVPPFSLSTREVYAFYDRVRGTEGWTLPDALDVETSGCFFGPNDLASAMLSGSLEMTKYLRAVAESVSESCLTGSGSAIVLRGASPEALRALDAGHPECRFLTTRTIGREEYQRRIHPSGGHSWK